MEPTTKEMTDAVDSMKKDFEKYKDEVVKLTQLCDAFEGESKRLAARCDVYEQLAKRSKKLVTAGDMNALKRLYVSVRL